ncbi:hypothetical protein TorRG33x02_043580 [Trema orientale]|uniref:Myb/SANT-like domain containing protein n=1 Tax=Trema orientale TaxID=63057 RepID=A0A2P5FQC0_TREOI|nr:hypothetical protein TorRG33x02_043580 [Trema orientale]
MRFSEKIDEIDKEIENDEPNVEFGIIDELVGYVSNSYSSTPIDSTQSGKKSRKRARNKDPLVDVLTKTLKEFSNTHAVASENIRKNAKYFQNEADGANRRMKLFDELKKVDGLTNAQRVKVGQLLLQNQANIDYFFTLDDEFKFDFLLQLLLQ